MQLLSSPWLSCNHDVKVAVHRDQRCEEWSKYGEDFLLAQTSVVGGVFPVGVSSAPPVGSTITHGPAPSEQLPQSGGIVTPTPPQALNHLPERTGLIAGNDHPSI
ncbi:hypothetical protein DPEC_G00050720 [Dallia pectoralis]|uniref:Uncharacterized protein n=1 Tax=Dallia pectoralis TaxID=75939 RepID=A0ACC2HBE9_DALPE|nr:hypothetical protein DPEC_G00050720 [Dallia pectoralis]